MQHNVPLDIRCAIDERLTQLVPSLDAALHEEIAQHLQDRFDELHAAGASNAEALREALAELDDDEGLRELARRPRRVEGEPIVPLGAVSASERAAWLRRFLVDLRIAARLARRSPGFTCVAVLTLALGIGANAAVFSLIDAVLVRPLPFPEPDRLVRLDCTKDGRPIFDPSALDVRDYARENHTFERLAAYLVATMSVSLLGPSAQPQQMPVGVVPEAYFAVLRIQPILGRLFTEEENTFGKHFVAMITRSTWQSSFAGDPAIIGRTLRINDEPYTIVGVLPDAMPEWLEVPPARIAVWMPFMTFPDMWSESQRGARGYRAIGRMKPGVTIAEAQADLSHIAANLEQRYTADHGFGVRVRPLADTRADTMTTSIRPMLLMLMGAVTLVLLIACANAANLLLARHAVRGRELAVRAALGASRAALVRQLLAEMIVLSSAGGALGVGIAWIGTRTLAALHSADAPQFGVGGVDLRVLAFTLTVSLLTGLIFGLAPAVIGSRANLIDTLRDAGRTGAVGGVRQRVRQVLVMAEVALALMLAIGAALLMQSIVRLQRQDLGFRADHLLKVHFFLPPARYPDPQSRTRFTDALVERLRTLPGVRDASVTMVYPPVNRYMITFMFVDRPVLRVEDLSLAAFGITDAHYVHTLGIAIRHGRDFADSDTESSEPVALVNEAFVRRFLPNEEPLGKQLAVDRPERLITRPPGRVGATIIGVVADTRSRGIVQTDGPQIYWLWRQHPTVNFGFKDVVIRTVDDPYNLTASVRDSLAALDHTLPLSAIKSMDDLLADQVADRRFTTFLLTVFAALGVALALIGVYGVISYLVAQRRSEIGLRIALGASRGDVLWLVIRQGLTTALVGIACGLVGAWAARQTFARLVFGISTLDLTTYLLAAGLLLFVAVAASAVPARRALRVDPMSALRCE